MKSFTMLAVGTAVVLCEAKSQFRAKLQDETKSQITLADGTKIFTHISGIQMWQYTDGAYQFGDNVTGVFNKVCGNYCGPGWCSGKDVWECNGAQNLGTSDSYPRCTTTDNCDESGSTDGSCADACCKAHDSCCGSSNRKPCNSALNSCLDACSGGPSCYKGIVPVSPSVIKWGFDKLSGECCGTAC